MKQEKDPHTLQKKTTGRAINKVVKKMIGQAQPGLTFKILTITLSIKFALIADAVESLDITLNNLASIRRGIPVNDQI